MPIPLQGTPGVFDPRNPTLVPNFDQPVASGGVVGLMSPAAFLAANPRTDATETATIGGTITAADTVALTFTCGTLPGGSLTVRYTVDASDDVAAVAEGLLDLINSSAVAQNVGLYAEMGGTSHTAEIVFHWNGPVGNFCVVTDVVGGSATETVTFGNAGVLTGGAGPIIPSNNFQWSPGGGSTAAFFYGQPKNIGYDQITAMVAQGMSIV